MACRRTRPVGRTGPRGSPYYHRDVGRPGVGLERRGSGRVVALVALGVLLICPGNTKVKDVLEIRVEPRGYLVHAEKGETIMAAAQRNGYLWPTICGGQASCKACVCEVMEGIEALEAMSKLESVELTRTFPTGHKNGRPLLLACQAVVVADVVVFKRGVR